MQLHAPSSQAGGDRFYDLSLRILMIVVSVALVGSIAFLTYRWLAPPEFYGQSVPITPVPARPGSTDVAPKAAPEPPKEVLLNPGQIFKCRRGGQVVFSEQPCTNGNDAGAAAAEAVPAAKGAVEPAKKRAP